MNADQFVARVSSVYGSDWLHAAAREVERRMELDGGHDFGHLARVLSNAMRIADGEEEHADRDVLAAAVVFHDVVNLSKNDPAGREASARSAAVARQWCRDSGRFSAAQVELVAEAVLCHSWSAGVSPESLEAKIVADADNLEAIGAYGIARTFYVAGRMGSSIVDMVDPLGEARPLDDRQFARDHFALKLLKLRDHMQTASGRREAERRHRVMVDFLAELDRETV